MLAVLQSPRFYSGISTLFDNIPKTVHVQTGALESFFVEDIITPGSISTTDLIQYAFSSPHYSDLDLTVDIVLENYLYLHDILLRDTKKQLPFILTGDFSLEHLHRLPGSYSFALRIIKDENKTPGLVSLPETGISDLLSGNAGRTTWPS